MDMKRYSRQAVIKEFGEDGQRKLELSHAAVIGAGGLGSPVLYYLAAAGVGNIKIIDSDTAEISNLNRQFIHFERDIERKKADSAHEKIILFNSEVRVKAYDIRVNDSNIDDLIKGSDIVLSCVDNLEARFVINKGCVKQKIAMVDGGVGEFSGYVLTVSPGVTPCYNCIFDSKAAKRLGVFGAGAGAIGSLMAVQAIKYLLGIREGLDLLFVDLLNFEFQKISAKINPDCPVCKIGTA